MAAVITYLSYWRKKRWKYSWAPGDRAPAELIQGPFRPRLIPIYRPEPADMPSVDDIALATLLKNQAILCSDKYFGHKILMTYRALELLVGPEEAAKQMWALVDEYLKEAA